MPLYTDGSRNGVPIAYNFTYGGNAVSWGSTSLTQMGDVSMRAEPTDGKFSVSELSMSFSDTNGSIWGSLGHGTSGLGSSWSATVYIGGDMGEQGYGPGGTRLARLNTTGAGTYVIHTGRITSISRKNRQVEINSQNAMSQLGDLEWRFPVYVVNYDLGAPYGEYYFQAGNIATSTGNKSLAFFNKSDSEDAFEAYGYVGSARVLMSDYPTPTGRGTMGGRDDKAFLYPGTQFYYDLQRILFKGTYLATYTGSVTSDSQAQSFGYANVGVAEAAKVSGSYYPNKTRLTMQGEVPTNLAGSFLFWQQVLTLGSTPADLWREMLTGCCVTPLFGSSIIDGVSLATARLNTAYQFHQQTINPKGGKVLPYLKDLLEPLGALWSMSNTNTFRLYTFGPKSLADSLGTIGMSEIIESDVSSSLDDKVNRLSIEYGYVYNTGSFSKRLETKATNWGSANDFPRSMKSQWLSNANDAAITGQRVLNRYGQGLPKLEITVPLTRLGADVGSLFTVVDADLYPAGKVFEVVGWSRDFSNSRSINLSMWDADSLYSRRGYARWEGDSSLTALVSGTSTSGWGTLGTVPNIGTAVYGSMFVWF